MTIAIYGRNIDKDDEKVWFLLRRLAAGGAKTYFCTSELQPSTDMLLALGGDGTFLRAINMLRGSEIPIAGINFGRLGFLTSAKVEEGENSWIDDLLKGNYTIQKRILLHVESDAIPHGIYPYALNEFSIQRQTPAMLRIDVGLGSERLPAYWADGVVVSTPTGSTAYSLSVGGPICPPNVEVLIIAPIAPHNLNVRPLVVAKDSVVELQAIDRKNRSVLLSVDNKDYVLPAGARIKVGCAPFSLKRVCIGKSSFIDALRSKLFWGEDVRNAR